MAEEMEDLYERYNNEINLGSRYDLLIKIEYLRSLRTCEVDMLKDVRSQMKEEN